MVRPRRWAGRASRGRADGEAGGVATTDHLPCARLRHGPDRLGPEPDPVGRASGALPAIGVTIVAAQRHAAQRRRARRAAGTDARGLAGLCRRIRQREVPTDPGERAAMRKLVDHQQERLERSARRLPYWLALMGLIAVALIALGVAIDSLPFPLVVALGLAVFCLWTLWMRRRSRERVRSMRSAMREEHEHVSSPTARSGPTRPRRWATSPRSEARAPPRLPGHTKRPPPLCVSAVRRGSLSQRGGARIRTWEG